MTIYAGPGATVEATLMYGTSGLAGTVRISIVDTPSGSTFLAASTSGIVEVGSKGVYAWSGTGPSTAGGYTVFWDLGSDATTIATEDLVVTSSAISAAAPTGSDLCTVAGVKTRLEITTTSTDTLIQTLITAASLLVMSEYQRDFAPVASATYTFPVLSHDGPLVDLAPHDLRTPTAVTLHPELGAGATTLVQDTDYALRPVGKFPGLGTYTQVMLSRQLNLFSTYWQNFGVAQLTIAGAWGPTTVPLDVNMGCVDVVASWMDRAVAQYAGNEMSGDGRDLRPDRLATWGIPASAHKFFSQYERQAAMLA